MRHRGAYPNKSRPFETTAHLFDLYCLRCTAECEDPPAGEFLAFFGGILVEVLDIMNAGRNDPIN